MRRKHTKFWWHILDKTGLLEDTGIDEWTVLILNLLLVSQEELCSMELVSIYVT